MSLTLLNASGSAVSDGAEIDFGNVYNGTDIVKQFTIKNETQQAVTNICVKAYDSADSKTAYRVILGGNLSDEDKYPSMVLASADGQNYVELKGDKSFLTLMETGTNLNPNDTVDFYLKISIPNGAVVDDQDFYLAIDYDAAQ